MHRSFEIASLSILDVKVVVVFLDRPADAFTHAALRSAAERAGLDSGIVAVWPDEFGRTRFLAPPEQHAFFQVVGYDQLRAQINGSLGLDSELR
jgi:hypothetical protein